MEYRIQLNATLDTIPFLLRQSLSFHGHDEFESSDDKGFFLELMRFLGDHNKEIEMSLKALMTKDYFLS
jgi:Domain of unknown function (DUF4371)